LKLTATFTEQLNAAKGRVRVILQRELFKPVQNLLKDKKGNCCMGTVYFYQQALYNRTAWPVELVANRISLADIFDRLGPFRYKSEANCHRCSNDYTPIVQKAIQTARTYVSHIWLSLFLNIFARMK
jgi:hypothetical protein